MPEPGGVPRRGPVGFVGVGRMGGPMATRLAQAGYETHCFDVATESINEMRALPGVHAAPTLAAVAEMADTVIMMLPDSDAVEEVLVRQEFLDSMRPGSVLIDMGSSEPTRTQLLADQAARREVTMLDAPVSGGVSGAVSGSLTVMVGGSRSDFEAVEPLLGVLGRHVIHCGKTGAGHATKALNNLMSATHLLAASEALLVAKDFGLDLRVVLDVVNSSSGMSGSTKTKWPRYVLTSAYDSGFSLQLMVKDMNIALRLAESLGDDAPLSRSSLGLWTEAAAELPAGADHTEIARWLADRHSLRETGASLHRGGA
jgi:3-hydroxyisobutyrate dehydrogenase